MRIFSIFEQDTRVVARECGSIDWAKADQAKHERPVCIATEVREGNYSIHMPDGVVNVGQSEGLAHRVFNALVLYYPTWRMSIVKDGQDIRSNWSRDG